MQQLGSFSHNSREIPVDPSQMYQVINNLTEDSHLDPSAKDWIRYRANADDVRGRRVLCLKGETLAEIAARGEIDGTYLETSRINKITILITKIAKKFYSDGGLEFILHSHKKNTPFYTLPNLSKSEIELYKSFISKVMKNSTRQPITLDVDRSTSPSTSRPTNPYLSKSNKRPSVSLFDEPANLLSHSNEREKRSDDQHSEVYQSPKTPPARKNDERTFTKSYVDRELPTHREPGLVNLFNNAIDRNDQGETSPKRPVTRRDGRDLHNSQISYNEIGFENLLAEANKMGETLPPPPVIKKDVLGNTKEFAPLLEETDQFLISLLEKEAQLELEKMKREGRVVAVDPDIFIANFVNKGLTARKIIRQKGLNIPAPKPLPLTQRQIEKRDRIRKQPKQPTIRKNPISNIPTHEEFKKDASKSMDQVLKDSGMTIRVSADNKKKPIDRQSAFLGGKPVFVDSLQETPPSSLIKKRKRQAEAKKANARSAKRREVANDQQVRTLTAHNLPMIAENKKEERLKRLRKSSITDVARNISRLMNMECSEILKWEVKKIRETIIQFQNDTSSWELAANLEALYHKKKALECGIDVRI